MKSFNPFKGLLETKRYPAARLIRTVAPVKFIDAFNILFGTRSHFGIFDYLTLFIGDFSETLVEWANPKSVNNKAVALLYYLGIAGQIISFIPKIILAPIVTLLLAPIILPIHGIANLIGDKTYEEALSLQGKTSNGGYQTIGELLEERKIDIENLELGVEVRDEECDISFYCKEIVDDPHAKKQAYRYPKIEGFHLSYKEEDRAKWSAFFQCNIGKIVSRVEEQADEATAEQFFSNFA